MKKILLALFVALTSTTSYAQAQDPVVWTATFRTISDKEGEILITGTVQKGWHTYSARPTDAGPIPTSITFAPSKEYQPEGKMIESGSTEEHDAAFDAKLYVFHEKAE